MSSIDRQPRRTRLVVVTMVKRHHHHPSLVVGGGSRSAGVFAGVKKLKTHFWVTK